MNPIKIFLEITKRSHSHVTKNGVLRTKASINGYSVLMALVGGIAQWRTSSTWMQRCPRSIPGRG